MPTRDQIRQHPAARHVPRTTRLTRCNALYYQNEVQRGNVAEESVVFALPDLVPLWEPIAPCYNAGSSRKKYVSWSKRSKCKRSWTRLSLVDEKCACKKFTDDVINQGSWHEESVPKTKNFTACGRRAILKSVNFLFCL